MTLLNEYTLNVDLKRNQTARVPIFRRGDTGVLIFDIFNDGVQYDISTATSATLYQKTKSGVSLTSPCEFVTRNNKRVVRYEFEEIAMVEIGYNTCILVIQDANGTVSIQPFVVVISDDLTGGAGSYIELIQDLINLIDDLVLDLDSTIKLSEKGVANGVASLDATGKIPQNQLPKVIDAYLAHITETVWKNQSHGFRIDADGIGQYEYELNSWQNIGFASTASGGGNFLNAEVTVADGLATVEYFGLPSVVTQKWMNGDRNLTYFNTQGNVFTGLTFPVTVSGLHTLYYQDSNGNKYTRVFNVNSADLNNPQIMVDVEDSVATVTIDRPVTVKKWAQGIRDIAYFQYNGTTFTGNTFNVTDVGFYSVYAKEATGEESVYVFEVTNDMIITPVINLTVVDSVANVTHTPNYTIQTSKWDNGSQNVEYFSSNGTAFTNNTFNVTQVGLITVYHKYTNGLTAIKELNVTQDMLIDSDITPPTMTFTQARQSNGDVIITVVATDSQSGVDSITLPNGTNVVASTATYRVTNNGDYEFKAYDKAGNEAIAIEKVTIIDRVAPVILYTLSPSTPTSGTVTVLTNITDDISGVKFAKWANGRQSFAYFISGLGNLLVNDQFTVTANGDYTLFAEDNAGNQSLLQFTVDNIIQATPEITLNPSITQYTKSPYDVSIQVTPITGVTVEKVAWVKGSQPITYFNTSGTVVTDNKFQVDSNSVYTVYVRNNAGGEAIKQITINNIDTVAPTISVTQSNITGGKRLSVSASDALSGIDRVELPDGTNRNVSTFTYDVFANGVYEFIAYDNAGNSKSISSTVTGIIINDKVIWYGQNNSIFKVDTSGIAYAQGDNSNGKLGINEFTSFPTTSSNTPIQVQLNGIKKVASGYSSTLFLTANGDVYIAGRYNGTNNRIPVKITSISGATDIVASITENSMFIKTNTGWYGLGDNSYGELGLGNSTLTNSPTLINSFSTSIADISSASNGTLFLLTNGDVFFTGRNKLPMGSPDATYTSPFRISGFSSSNLPKKVVLSEDGQNAFFILNTGSVMAMGYNRNGELGLGHTSVVSSSPILIYAGTGTKDITTGFRTTSLITSTGTIKSTGYSGTNGLSSDVTTWTDVPFSGGTVDYLSKLTTGILYVTTANRVYGTGAPNGNAFANGGTAITGAPTRLTNLE